MKFVPISINEYVKKHMDNNPSANEKELRKRLKLALKDYKNGVKCSCGNDIWVIGSSVVGNRCFTCITGESDPQDDYEIEEAIKKGSNLGGKKHIDEINQSQVNGFFDDDGYEIDTDLMKKPSLCLICRKNDDPNEEMLCNMMRYDQKDEEDFLCAAFVKK